MISLIHPSRCRAYQAKQAAENWISRAGCSIQYILSLDSDEPQKMSYIGNDLNFIVNSNRSAVDAINNAAKESTGDILVVMSDDFDCPQDWGKQIISLTTGKTDWIAKTPDGIQRWMITLPIMDRHYYNRFGYVYYPEYRHLFCDTELTCVADLLQRKIELPINFVHNHYSVSKSKKDEISVRADATQEQGEKLFIERAKKNFDLVNPPGKIVAPEYINWMRGKGIKV